MAIQILKINNKCSNNCYSCSNCDLNVDNTEKSIEQQIESLDNTKELLIKDCEPIESNNFFKILSLLKQKQFKNINIITNGKNFSELDFCKEFSEYSNIVKVIIFKILGPEPEIHDSLTRTKQSFEQTYQGIINLLNMKINIGIIFTILEQNFMYMEQIINKFTQLGIKNIILEYPQNKGKCKKEYEKIAIKFSDFNNLLIKVLNNYNFPIQTLNIPLCFLEEHTNHSLDKIWNLNKMSHKNHIEICDYCSKKKDCCLIEDQYLTLFGEEEFYEKSELKEIIIELNSNCNLKCGFCFNQNYYNKDTKNKLTTEKVKQIINKFPKFIKNIRFTGGEPLLRNDLEEIFDYVQKKGFKIWLNTNATLINENNINIIEEYVDNVLVQLNSWDKISEIENSCQDVFDDKIKGIKLLKESKISTIRIGTALIKKNIYDIEKIFVLVNNLKIDDWEFYREIPTIKNKRPISKEDMNFFIKELNNLNQKHNKNYKIVNAFPFCCNKDLVKTSEICKGAESDDGHIRFVIGTDLIARPSYFLNYTIGNLEKDEIKDCWNNEFMIKIRTLKFIPESCKKCEFVQKCKGGSRFVAQLINNDYSKDDYLAEYENIKN
tara:strand:- start:4959 stop:6773 length:1815 start_codon:yes stop_codon:yes gene_type:complete